MQFVKRAPDVQVLYLVYSTITCNSNQTTHIYWIFIDWLVLSLQLSSLDQRLEQSKRDSRKLTHTLEEVMASHTQLQTAMENLHQELGHKDSQISQLTTEK